MSVPTRSDVAGWNVDQLRVVGEAHEKSATELREMIDSFRNGMYSISDDRWAGDARVAAHNRADSEEVEVKRAAESIGGLGRALVAASAAVSDPLNHMRNIAQWAEGGDVPFSVSNTWEISDPASNPSPERVEQMRNWQADLTSLGQTLELVVAQHARTIEACRAGVEVSAPPAAGFGPDGLGLVAGQDASRDDLEKWSLAYEDAFGRPPQTPEEWTQASGLLAELPWPGDGYGSYHHDLPFVVGKDWTRAQMVHYIADHFNQYFPFRADEAEGDGIAVGDEIGLNSPAGDQPVRVEQITNEGFVLTSLPGHFEGAGRTIVFSIEPNSGQVGPDYKRWDLHVEAGGPLSWLSLSPINGGVAKEIWRGFAGNMTSRLPLEPPR